MEPLVAGLAAGLVPAVVVHVLGLDLHLVGAGLVLELDRVAEPDPVASGC